MDQLIAVYPRHKKIVDEFTQMALLSASVRSWTAATWPSSAHARRPGARPRPPLAPRSEQGLQKLPDR